MSRFLSVLFVLSALLAPCLYAQDDAVGPAQTNPVDLNRWSLLQTYYLAQGSNLGAAYAGGHHWITNGGSSSLTNDNFLIRMSGMILDTIMQPDCGSGWGWRDMAFDGTYLYAGCEANLIYAFSCTTGVVVPSMAIPKPATVSVVRALAYDPNTDHFWTGSFTANLVEFTRSGSIVWQGSPAPLTAVAGMAFQEPCWLWILDQNNNTFHQFNTVTHAFTGEAQILPPIPGLTAALAGGCEINDFWVPTVLAMEVLVQGTTQDAIAIMEVDNMSWTLLEVNLAPINPPIVIPANGGSFEFNASVVRHYAPQAPFSVWARIKYPDGSYTPPMLGPVTINPPVGNTVTRIRTQNVPGSWPSGTYAFIGYANSTFTYPAIDSSWFTFMKSATADGGPIVWEASCTGEPFPGEPSPRAFIPSGLDLGISPNPFNPTTVASYELRVASQVSLRVYDVSGRLVSTLVDGRQEAGTHSVTFDGSKLASGMYFVRMQAGDYHSAQKLMLLK